MNKPTITYGHGEENRDTISSDLTEVAMDEFTYTAQDGCEITLVYNPSANDENVVKSIKSLMEAMVIKQVRCTKEVEG